MKLVHDKRIPFILLTNGGGVTEAQKAHQMEAMLRIPISERQVVLSHTPMKALSARYSNALVLFIGPDSIKDVAAGYGFHRAITADDILAWNQSVWPFHPVQDYQVLHVPFSRFASF